LEETELLGRRQAAAGFELNFDGVFYFEKEEAGIFHAH
jgi:hypothetical protein